MEEAAFVESELFAKLRISETNIFIVWRVNILNSLKMLPSSLGAE
jgi:hypothetical protein